MKILLFLLCLPLAAQECRFASVEWLNTTMVTSPDLSDPDQLLTPHKALGCVLVGENTVTIVQSMVNDKPFQVIVVPKPVITALQYLEPANDNTPRPQVLPNVQDKDQPRSTGTRADRVRLMRLLRKGGIL